MKDMKAAKKRRKDKTSASTIGEPAEVASASMEATKAMQGAPY